MIRKLALALVMLAGIYGCSTPSILFNTEHPGLASVAGGELQLLFANPEYSDMNDKLVRDDFMQKEIFGKKNGYPSVTGGIGMMQVWRF